MGASASVQHTTNIYISYDERDIQGYKNIQQACSVLENQDLFKHNKYQFLQKTSVESIETAMNQSECIIFCISSYTQCSYTQNLELKIATHSKNSKKILYVVTTEKFNPKENPETKAIVGNHRWKPLYNENYTSEFITDILLQCR